jgi:NADPH:quinone reductase
MLSALVSRDTKVTLQETPLPSMPHPHALLIRVVTCGTNPKDWKLPAGILKTIGSTDPRGCNSGDDVAGYVAAVGSAVVDFHVGDAVAGLHELGVLEGGAFAEYAVVMDWVAFHLGRGQVDFDAAATMPMASHMAAIGLFGMLRLSPGPWAPLDNEAESKPLVIYGAAGAVGAYAVKFASLANIHPLICVAGRGSEFVHSLLDESKGDVVIDYRPGSDHVVQSIRDTLSTRSLLHAFDTVSTGDSFANLGQLVAPEGHISLVLPGIRPEIPSHIRQSTTMAGCLWKDMAAHANKQGTSLGMMDVGRNGREFGLMFSRLIGLWYREGTLKPHPVEVVAGGLRGLETALMQLKDGTASAVKYVVRVGETEELRGRVDIDNK